MEGVLRTSRRAGAAEKPGRLRAEVACAKREAVNRVSRARPNSVNRLAAEGGCRRAHGCAA